MQKGLVSIPGYRVYQYSVVLAPPPELCARLVKLKKEAAEKYKSTSLFGAKPHLTLVQFFAYEMTEEKLLHRLQVIAMGLTPFKIEVNNFSSLPSHSIYLNVSTKNQLQQAVRELKTAQVLMTLNKETKPHFTDGGNLLLCTRLTPAQYNAAWIEYKHRHFSGRFIADNMLLIKRPAATKSAYQIVKRLEFQNLPVATKQGNLF